MIYQIIFAESVILLYGRAEKSQLNFKVQPTLKKSFMMHFLCVFQLRNIF